MDRFPPDDLSTESPPVLAHHKLWGFHRHLIPQRVAKRRTGAHRPSRRPSKPERTAGRPQVTIGPQSPSQRSGLYHRRSIHRPPSAAVLETRPGSGLFSGKEGRLPPKCTQKRQKTRRRLLDRIAVPHPRSPSVRTVISTVISPVQFSMLIAGVGGRSGSVYANGEPGNWN